ncbi:MAG: DUF7487 domain-containing protein [Nitrosopumilaceae archaeon]
MINLLEDIYKITHQYSSRTLSNYARGNKLFFQRIINNTPFLSKNATVATRIFCIKNKIMKPPICEVCLKVAKWRGGKVGYSRHCSMKCANNNKQIIKARKTTNLKKYGVDIPSKSKVVKEKAKTTNLERYGVMFTGQLASKKEKTHITWMKKYGVHNPTYINFPIEHLQKLSSFDWMFDQYINQNKSTTQIAYDLNINATTVCNYLRRLEIKIRHNFSCKAIQWIESIMKEQNIFIQHMGNIGEYKIPNTRFHADGYCEKTNTIYEFYGNIFHGNPNIFKSHESCSPFNPQVTAGELYQKTLKRENKIKSMGYNLVVMWESNFLPMPLRISCD